MVFLSFLLPVLSCSTACQMNSIFQINFQCSPSDFRLLPSARLILYISTCFPYIPASQFCLPSSCILAADAFCYLRNGQTHRQRPKIPKFWQLTPLPLSTTGKLQQLRRSPSWIQCPRHEIRLPCSRSIWTRTSSSHEHSLLSWTHRLWNPASSHASWLCPESRLAGTSLSQRGEPVDYSCTFTQNQSYAWSSVHWEGQWASSRSLYLQR